jgi:hypothetical protein
MCRIAPESVHLNRRESICRESGVNIFLTFVPRFFAPPVEQKIVRAESLVRRCCARLRQNIVDAELLQCPA